ncbi:MAG TPA: protein DA1 [Chloroflexia bacterium]|nr:protein DA1 [Chloroflexia bacterium]
MGTIAPVGRGNWCSACGTGLVGHEIVRLSMGGADPSAHYYCTACAGGLLRCAACRRPLDGAAGHLFALAGQTHRLYCPDCWARPHCHACSRPVGALSYRRPDGRVFCDPCHATAVYDPVVAEALFAQVKATAARALGLELSIGAALHLASREQIAQLRGTAPGADPLPGLGVDSADYVGLFVYSWRVRSIYVEYGLPRIFFCEVLAHEYAHAWQAENAPLLADPELREGFAEWGAYKVVESWGCRLRLDRFRQRQDLYGAGLRRMLAWEAAGGVAGVLDRIQKGSE